MRRKMADIRQRLTEALRNQLTQEIHASGNRIREGIAPYSRFIRSEGDKLKAIDQELQEIAVSISRLRDNIERSSAN